MRALVAARLRLEFADAAAAEIRHQAEEMGLVQRRRSVAPAAGRSSGEQRPPVSDDSA